MSCIGIDIVEIARIERAISRWGEGFLHRVYTDPELKLYHNRPSSLATRFAGKEAVIKALEPQTKSIGWKEIEILSHPNGKPSVRLYGEAQNRADILGLGKLAISLSHCKAYAVALVAGETRPG